MEPFYNDLTESGLLALGWERISSPAYEYVFRYERLGAPALLLFSNGASAFLKPEYSTYTVPLELCMGNLEAYLYGCLIA